MGVRFVKVVGGWAYQNEEHGGWICKGGWLDLQKRGAWESDLRRWQVAGHTKMRGVGLGL